MRRLGRWRERASRFSDLPDPPGGVFWGFGILLAGLLVAGGIYCLLSDGFFLPIYRGDGVDLTKAGARSVGVTAFGVAAMLHFGTVWRALPGLRRPGNLGLLAGLLTTLVGVAMQIL